LIASSKADGHFFLHFWFAKLDFFAGIETAGAGFEAECLFRRGIGKEGFAFAFAMRGVEGHGEEEEEHVQGMRSKSWQSGRSLRM
jgi:hypothetical protein